MILGTACLADSALDGEAICSALEVLGLQKVLLRAAEGLLASGLGEVPAVAVRCTWSDRRLGIAAASSSRSRLLVLDLPESATLAAACKQLFEFGRQTPGLALAVVTPAAGELARPERLELLLDDLAAQGLGWWHVPSRALLAEHDDVTWFDRLGRRLVGVSLDDVADGAGGLPPGLGALDLRRLAELTGRGVEATLDTDAVPDPALLASAVATLQAAGFR